MPVVIGALKEVAPNESRVALVPEVAGKFAALGARILIERGAGEAAQFPDSSFKNTEFLPAAQALLQSADVLLKVQPPTIEEITTLRKGAVVIGFMQAHQQRRNRTRAA